MLTDRVGLRDIESKSVISSPLNNQRRYAANPLSINQDIEQHNQQQSSVHLNQTMPLRDGPAENAITMSAPYSFRNEANIMAAEAE